MQRSIAFCLCVCFVFGCTKNGSDPRSNATANPSIPLFSLIPATQSHIEFQNSLTEGLNTNILLYEYFYNGGGVAAADFNNDGLIDLYFTGNMVDNKLYLNKGNLQFEDVSLIAHAEGRPGPWKTGVTAVDINGDRLLDLYVCYSGALPEAKRMNQLLINKGNNPRGIPIFEDQAASYGLNSPAYSTQAYFFDYDLDHDLDMLLLNHNPKNLPILNESSTAELLKQDDPMRGTRLFRHDQDGFKDVTIISGIQGSPLSYGLGLAITDVNEDGWPDFYISNDYAVPDYLYENNKNGTFTNVLQNRMGHTSQFSMGNEVADINNDGHPDIFTLDMLPEDNHRQKLLLAPDNYSKFDLNVRSGFYYQYMRNMLHLHTGNSNFSEIGQLAGVSNTDWSWSALMADFDDDGLKDLHITNGYLRDYTNLDFINYMDQYTKEKGRLVREDVMEIIGHMPASNVSNYMFRNTDGLHFKDASSDWGLYRPSNSNGCAYADLDNDGDLDLITNNINAPAFIYQNQSQSRPGHHALQIQLKGIGLNTLGLGAKISIIANGTSQYLEQHITRGYQSSVTPVLHFGLPTAQVDTLCIQWPGGKQQVLINVRADQTLVLEESNASLTPAPKTPMSSMFQPVTGLISFTHDQQPVNDFDRQSLLIQKLSHQGPTLAAADLNADGLEEIIAAGSGTKKPMIYYQNKNKTFSESIPLDDESAIHYDGPIEIFDANGDHQKDIFIGGGGYHDLSPDASMNDRLYIQGGPGKKEFTIRQDALPALSGSKGCVTSLDINQDGHLDLFVGGRVIPGRYPEAPASFLLINDGTGKFSDQTSVVAPDISHIGMVTDALSLDINHDQKTDLILVGEWMPVTIFINEGNHFVNRTNSYFDREYRGWWNSIVASDINQDGTVDFIVGNAGTNMQIHATNEEPSELYFKDFDHNGSVDPLLCTYIQGRSYPYITRDELVKQLAGFRQRFTSFESYSNVVITDLFTKNELKDAGHLSINTMESTCLLSQGDGKYLPHALPVQAQYAPVHTITIKDLNHDGKDDLLLCGNNDHFKIRLGKSDANYGMVLTGNGRGSFEYMDQIKSGLSLKGDVRSVIVSGQNFIFGINNQAIQVYKLKP